MKVKWWKWLYNIRKDLREPPKDNSFVICSEHFNVMDISNYEQRLMLLANPDYRGTIAG
jgi:hypothetical protein